VIRKIVLRRCSDVALDWNRCIATAWKNADLSYLLHAGQLKIEDAFLRIAGKLFVGDCSRQFGKSTWAASKCVEKALRKRKAKVRYATAFLTDLEQFIRPAFDFVLADCPAHLRPKFHEQKYEYRFPNGSVIKLVGLDRKPNGLRGNKLDLVVIDEAAFVSRLGYLYRSVIVPATTHVPDARIILISTQPESPDHEFVEFCDRAELENCYAKFTVYENPLLAPEQIEDLAKECGGKETTDFRREYLCERVVDENLAIIPDWKPEFRVEREKTEADGFYHRYIFMDIGVRRDKTVLLFAFFDYRGQYLYVEDELVINAPKVTTKAIAKQLREKLEERPEYQNAYRRIADNSHPLLINDLAADESISFIETDKGKLHEMVVELRDWVQRGRFRVNPRCKFLLGSLRSGIWNKRRDDFERSKVFGHYDAIAASVYGVRNTDQQSNPIPSWFQFNPAEQFRREKKQNERAAGLAAAFNGRRR
jgi:hypothetical protein